MRFLKARFKNYIGFYNGMGLDEINIDFSKCTHSIVLIEGANGCGKSSLLEHLNIFPDPSNDFIPERTAEKDLILTNGTDIYNIQIISPADSKGRKTTKAYIQKNGIELNENGNISTYKDIIYSEFELDSNYLSLSRLSSIDRGLGDKTPAERKKFVANIINNLEIYNSMYKTLNKKSLIFKSHIGTLHTKIQNIGSKENLEQRLTSLQSKEVQLNMKIMQNNNNIVAIQTKNSIDETEAAEIQKLTSKESELKSNIDECEVSLNMNFHTTKIKKEEILDKFAHDSNLLETTTAKLNEVTNSWKEKSNRLSEMSTQILSIESEIASIDTNDEVSKNYTKCKSDIESIKNQLGHMGIAAETDLILPITKLLGFCDKFIAQVDHFYDNVSTDDIEFIVNSYSTEYVNGLIGASNNVSTLIEQCKQQLPDIQSKVSLLATLENRPSKCKIDTCPFISEALKLSKSNVDPVDELTKLQNEILQLSTKLTEIQELIDYANNLSGKAMELRMLKSTISEYKEEISIFYPELLTNLDYLLINLNPFNNIREHSNLTDGLNLLKILDSELQKEKILEVEYRGYREKIQILNSSKSILNNLYHERDNLTSEIMELKSKIDNFNGTIDSINKLIKTEEIYAKIYTTYLDLNQQLQVVQAELNKFNEKSAKALEALSVINNLKAEIDVINQDLIPVKNEISTINGQLTLLDSYYTEYAEYKKSFDTIETVKKYCSPTGGGIQTLFMQIYMSKTKDLANEILAMLFGGSYKLLDFIINESEFRIPFIGEGLPVDDISSGSSSQIAMMSLIINLVLLHQASTTFNIAQLDEVTANLDPHVNSQFTNVLFHSMNILNIEQLFLISHSTEIDNTFADIIKFKGYDDYESAIKSGNIIWDYDEIVGGK